MTLVEDTLVAHLFQTVGKHSCENSYDTLIWDTVVWHFHGTILYLCGTFLQHCEDCEKKYCRTLRDTLSEPFWKPGLAALPCVTHHIHSDIQIEVKANTAQTPHPIHGNPPLSIRKESVIQVHLDPSDSSLSRRFSCTALSSICITWSNHRLAKPAKARQGRSGGHCVSALHNNLSTNLPKSIE
jgi:hypothetical protein